MNMVHDERLDEHLKELDSALGVYDTEKVMSRPKDYNDRSTMSYMKASGKKLHGGPKSWMCVDFFHVSRAPPRTRWKWDPGITPWMYFDLY